MNKLESKVELSPEERDLLDPDERGEWQSVNHLQEKRQQYQAYASAGAGSGWDCEHRTACTRPDSDSTESSHGRHIASEL